MAKREERKKSSADPLVQPTGPREGGALEERKTLCRLWLLPEQGISLPPLGPCSEFSAGWDQSLSGPRLTHSHISLSGGEGQEERDPAREKKKKQTAEGLHAGRQTHSKSRRDRLLLHTCLFPPVETVYEAGWLGSISSQCGVPEGGQAASRVTLFCDLLTLEPYCKHYDSSGL